MALSPDYYLRQQQKKTKPYDPYTNPAYPKPDYLLRQLAPKPAPQPAYTPPPEPQPVYTPPPAPSPAPKPEPKPEPAPTTQVEDFFRDLPQWTYYKPMSTAEQRRLAQEYASMYIDPQIAAVQRSLEQAIADAAAQEERIRAAYAGTEQMLGRREEQQAARDLESAISRGAGRSGVVDWLARERGEYFAGLLSEAEAKRAAELSAVVNQLALKQRQAPEQITALEAQRGALASQELNRLRELEYQRQREHDLDQWARMLGIFDRTMLTPAQQMQLELMYAEQSGQFPGSTPGWYGRW